MFQNNLDIFCLFIVSLLHYFIIQMLKKINLTLISLIKARI